MCASDEPECAACHSLDLTDIQWKQLEVCNSFIFLFE
jgi:hypothetical protein